ncbi:MAG TPA: hypothetical protein G4O10_05470 [Dehalococcoidia bacterium]|nr:hypothetical protein [Dehalococcoidia bacterium]
MKKRISRILGVGLTLALVSSLLVSVVPAMAVSIPQLTIPTAGDNVINTVNADYNVYFQTNKELTAGDVITITFPAGYGIAAPTASIAASEGWYTNPAPPPTTLWGGPFLIGTGTWGNAGQAITYTLAAGEIIGELSNIRIEITAGVTNPSATGDYAVAVKTTQEPVAVSSNTVTLVTPTIPPLPGVVTGYNSADQILYQNIGPGTITAALGVAGVVKVTLDNGTYAETPINIGAGQTIISVNGKSYVIMTGTVNLTAATSVLDAVTVTGAVNLNANATVKNCSVSGGGITFGAAATAAKSIGNTIAGAGLIVTGAGSSTGDTFNVAALGTGITNGGTLTLSNATVVGASGTGLDNNAGTSTVTGSSFSNLSIAITSDGGTVSVSTSTIDGCGTAGAAPTGAVQINGGVVLATANTITDGPNAIARVTALGTGVGSYFKFNTFTGNAASFANGGAGTLDATNNWWGTTAGPAVASTGLVLTNPWLIAELVNPTVAISAANTLVASAATSAAVSGVAVTITPVAPSTGVTLIATGNYDGNPVTAEPPADTVRSFDVYIQGPAASMLSDTATIVFSGVTDPNAQVYAYSDNQDMYVLCSNQRVDLFNGTVIVTVMGTGSGTVTVPNLGNLSGLEFVITEPGAPVLVAPTQASLVPAFAAEGVTVDSPSFAWGAIAGADYYNFELAPYLPGSDAFIPAFLIRQDIVNVSGIVIPDTLDYSTTYAWRVRAGRGSGSVLDEFGPWVSSFFTTEAEPEEAPPPVEIIQSEPPVINIPDWPDTIYQEQTPIIPDYLLWVVVGVGAVLVIAVIVLIVRTRRVA